mmetsp:Transcript_50470/g.134193  ORF Transcript_50470/g.134193 Transcript_50470/m.134193 type:complete len:204 (-) Transcript_50470:227-838(-)
MFFMESAFHKLPNDGQFFTNRCSVSTACPSRTSVGSAIQSRSCSLISTTAGSEVARGRSPARGQSACRLLDVESMDDVQHLSDGSRRGFVGTWNWAGALRPMPSDPSGACSDMDALFSPDRARSGLSLKPSWSTRDNSLEPKPFVVLVDRATEPCQRIKPKGANQEMEDALGLRTSQTKRQSYLGDSLVPVKQGEWEKQGLDT